MAQAKPKGAFIFWAPDADPAKHGTTISLDSSELVVVGVGNYDQAVDVSKKLVKEGAMVPLLGKIPNWFSWNFFRLLAAQVSGVAHCSS
jgi:hypothetical protein